MSRTTKLTAGAAAVVLAGFLVAGGIAHAQRRAGLAGHQRMLQRMAVVLDLSDSQVSQIQAIFQQNMATAQPLFQQLQAERQALAQAVENGKTDTATLQPLANQVGQIVSQLALLHAQVAGQVYPILTPAQQAKAKKLHGLFQQHARAFMMRQNAIAQ